MKKKTKKLPNKFSAQVRSLREKREERKLALRDATAILPRITNETVAVHREEVLRGARKYIYPLQHSKHRVVIITSTLFVLAVLTFLSYSVAALYNFQSTNTFIYRVTQVLPFPVAREGSHFISYENYLFELRHYMHYYESQQKLSFKSASGKQQLDAYKKQALDKVDNDARIKKVAEEKGISVSDAEVDAQIALARKQNRLGGSDRVFEDVIKEYYGWSLTDFKRSLRSQLLAEKVSAELDDAAKAKIEDVKTALSAGTPFADVVKNYSEDDATKAQNGDFGEVDLSNTAISPQTVDALFKLQPGQVSEPIVVSSPTGYAYEVIKCNEKNGNKAKGAHIIVKIQDISGYLKDQKSKQPTRAYIKLNS